MISKISYIKLIREDIRHRGWLAALSGVLLFLSMPVYTLIYLDSYSEDPEVLKEFADTFSGFINGYNSAFLIILIGILAFAVGISGFQFMHKKEKLDFYHGLALKRHQLFAIANREIPIKKFECMTTILKLVAIVFAVSVLANTVLSATVAQRKAEESTKLNR